MRLRKLALSAVAAGMIAFSASTASAAWYDGGLLGMQDKFCNWLAELVVCDGWSGCR